MATHDYVIDNQSASAFRSDLNNVLQAILTQNSSATAPTTATANMIWYDTTNKQLKKRNEAGSAWIVLGTIDEGTGTFTPSGSPPTQDQTVWNTGTGTTESTITPAKLDDKIENKLNASGSAPMYACRAWVNFNGTGTVAIRASGNVSSITDNGVGQYTVNFTTAMPDANYSANITTGAANALTTFAATGFVQSQNASQVTIYTGTHSNSSVAAYIDMTFVNVTIFR